jgi:hypothetical protein
MPAQAASLPLQGEASAFLNSTLIWNYGAAPAGANVRCTPSAAHPYPVILTERTFASMYNSFGAISPDLVDNGYCVYAFNYGQTIPLTGFYAMGDIPASAAQLSTEVNKVLSQTGASRFDIVGWRGYLLAYRIAPRQIPWIQSDHDGRAASSDRGSRRARQSPSMAAADLLASVDGRRRSASGRAGDRNRPAADLSYMAGVRRAWIHHPDCVHRVGGHPAEPRTAQAAPGS